MKMALIGHRGVGKTTLLKRLAQYWPEVSNEAFLCLDRCIEESTGKIIPEIFDSEGEAQFRQHEKDEFHKIVKAYDDQPHCVVALGAGYLGDIPSSWTVLWVQRSIDPTQSRFLHRPLLDSEALIPNHRFSERERRYEALSDHQLVLREHRGAVCSYEKLFFESLWRRSYLKWDPSYFITLTKGNFSFLKFQKSPVEIRDDHWDWWDPKLESFFQENRVLLSFRNPDKKPTKNIKNLLGRAISWDWPVEWGACPYGSPPILSLHERADSIEETFRIITEQSVEYKLEKSPILKLAIPIHTFSELQAGEQWRQQDSSCRVFLPLSKEGRWRWYRCHKGREQPLNFFRLSSNHYKDQPFWWQVLSDAEDGIALQASRKRNRDEHGELHLEKKLFKKESQGQYKAPNFSAILGNPVNHSLSPWFHQSFFGERGLKFFEVPLREDEFEEGMSVLWKMGLRYAAVTSPLKTKAGRLARSFEPLNTLAWGKECWHGANTDILGAKNFLSSLRGQGEPDSVPSVAVWGGGGVLQTLRTILPRARFFSSRTGRLRSDPTAVETTERVDFSKNKPPEHLIWAVGASRFMEKGVWPPEDWDLKTVYDINYDQSSPALTLANQRSIPYVGGWAFFQSQALSQQKFWSEYVGQSIR